MSSTTDQIEVASVPWWRKTKAEAYLAFIVFVAPMVIGLIIFTFVPIIWGTLISFSEARNTISIGDWVGFENYRAILSNQEFQKSLRTIVIFTIFIVPLTFFFSLLLAMLVNSIGFGTPIFRTIFFIPTAMSYVIASIIWKMGIFNGGPFGMANMILYWFNKDAPVIAWIGTADPPYYWVVLVSVRVWLQVGFYMILFIAALQEIDETLYEAAQVDGAKLGWYTFWTITFPLLRNTSIAVLMLNFIAAFQAFDEFINILGGVGSVGNISLARPPLVYLYQVAIQQQDYGRGSAGAIIVALIIIVITLVQGRVFGFGRRA